MTIIMLLSMENSDETLSSKHTDIENCIALQNILSKKHLSNTETSLLQFYVKILGNSKKDIASKYEEYRRFNSNIAEIYKKQLEEQKAIYDDRILSQRKIFQEKIDEQKNIYVGHIESLIRENLFYKQMLESADRTIKTSIEKISILAKEIDKKIDCNIVDNYDDK